MAQENAIESCKGSSLDRVLTSGFLRVGQFRRQAPGFFEHHDSLPSGKTKDDLDVHALPGGQGYVVGFDVQIARAIADALQVTLRFDRTFHSYDAVIQAVCDGRVDLGISKLSIKPDRARRVYFSSAYLVLSPAILYSPRARPRPRSLELLCHSGMRIGLVGKTSYYDWFKEACDLSGPSVEAWASTACDLHDSRHRIILANDGKELVERFADGCMDAAYYDDASLTRYLREGTTPFFPAAAHGLYPVFGRRDHVAVALPKDSDFLNFVNAIIASEGLTYDKSNPRVYSKASHAAEEWSDEVLASLGSAAIFLMGCTLLVAVMLGRRMHATESKEDPEQGYREARADGEGTPAVQEGASKARFRANGWVVLGASVVAAVLGWCLAEGIPEAVPFAAAVGDAYLAVLRLVVVPYVALMVFLSALELVEKHRTTWRSLVGRLVAVSMPGLAAAAAFGMLGGAIAARGVGRLENAVALRGGGQVAALPSWSNPRGFVADALPHSMSDLLSGDSFVVLVAGGVLFAAAYAKVRRAEGPGPGPLANLAQELSEILKTALNALVAVVPIAVFFITAGVVGETVASSTSDLVILLFSMVLFNGLIAIVLVLFNWCTQIPLVGGKTALGVLESCVLAGFAMSSMTYIPKATAAFRSSRAGVFVSVGVLVHRQGYVALFAFVTMLVAGVAGTEPSVSRLCSVGALSCLLGFAAHGPPAVVAALLPPLLGVAGVGHLESMALGLVIAGGPLLDVFCSATNLSSGASFAAFGCAVDTTDDVVSSG